MEDLLEKYYATKIDNKLCFPTPEAMNAFIKEYYNSTEAVSIRNVFERLERDLNTVKRLLG
jgi:hypothetical protein